MLGEWRQNAAEMPAALERARERGDRYTETMLSLVSAGYAQFLTKHMPDDGEAAILERLAKWPRTDSFDLQQMYGLQGLVNLDLYRGKGGAAWERISQGWRAVERSGLLRITLLRTFLEEARARAAIGHARECGGTERRALLRVARRSAGWLVRSKARYAPALGHLLAAGVAAVEGNSSEMRTNLAAAEAGFERTETVPWLAATRLAMAEFAADSSMKERAESGMEWMNSQEIERSECFTRMLFPALR
jgi:hypothetical protein